MVFSIFEVNCSELDIVGIGENKCTIKVIGALNFEVISVLDGTQKKMRRAIDEFGRKLSKGGVGFFYYSGAVGLERDLNETKKYWLLSASQYLDNRNICEAEPKELLEEINQYNPNPTKEMIEIRDFFYNLISTTGV